MTIQRYRLIPQDVEAVFYNGHNLDEVLGLINKVEEYTYLVNGLKRVWIYRQGDLPNAAVDFLDINRWVILTEDGKILVRHPDAFARTWERIPPDYQDAPSFD